MRTLFISILLIIHLGLFAKGTTSTKRVVTDTIQERLDRVKNILYSGEWKAVNKDQLNKIGELIEFIENSPIDSVVVQLKNELDTTQQIVTRDWQQISEVDSIEGYIRAWEINNSIVNIEKKAKENLPLESILVPEDEFVDMYSKLPLITYGNMSRLLNDSIVTLPDSLLLMKADAKLTHSTQKVKVADSVVSAYLNSQRKAYNNRIIEAYRDSVSNEYRKTYQKQYIDTLVSQYTDSVATHNLKVLRAYNDSVTVIMNRKLSDNLNSLLTYVNRMPYDITVYNYYNDSTTLPLQNDAIWYEWIWLKNAQNDSLGLRVENLDKHHFRVLIDEGATWTRLRQQGTLEVDKIKHVGSLDQKLLKMKERKPELSPWKLDGKVYTGFTQTYINQYWSKGGTSSASVLSTFNYDANYSKGKIKFENGVDGKLGLIYYLPDEGTTVYRNWHKNNDMLELNSRFGYSAFKEWYYSAEANFKTQFFLGYKSNNDSIPNSAIFSPAYLTFSAGFDYKPGKEFSAFLAPISVKTTYVTNPKVDVTRFGLEEGQTRKTRFGMAGKFEFSKKMMENIALRSKNSIFINYGMNNDGEWQLIKIPDFDSETTIDFKINQFISTQMNFHFIYDKDVTSTWTNSNGVEQSGTRLQVKEYITFGISYKF